MRTLYEVVEEFKEKREKLDTEYKTALEGLLAERGLDRRVIRKKDGVEGELKVHFNYGELRVSFYHVTKKGTLSMYADEDLYTFLDNDELARFEPKDMELTNELPEEDLER